MKKYLHETSHRWIALGLMLVVPIMDMLNFFTSPNKAMLSVISIAIILILQWANEYIQKNDPDEIVNHGGYELFIIESKKDWKHCLQGTGIGLIVQIIYWILK